MRSPAEQFSGVTGRRQHSVVRWADRISSTFSDQDNSFFSRNFWVVDWFFPFLIVFLLFWVAQLRDLKTMSLPCWPVDLFLHAAVFTSQRLLLETAAQFQPRAGCCKAKWFSCFLCVLSTRGTQHFLFLRRTLLWLKITAVNCHDWNPWLWSFQTSAPARQSIQLAWGLPLPCPFSFPFSFLFVLPCKKDTHRGQSLRSQMTRQKRPYYVLLLYMLCML